MISTAYKMRPDYLNQPFKCSGQIYDGTFSQTLIDGDGVTITLLKRNGIKVVNEEDFQLSKKLVQFP